MDDKEELALLRELVHWHRFQNRVSLRSALEEILTTATDRKILSENVKKQFRVLNRVSSGESQSVRQQNVTSLSQL